MTHLVSLDPNLKALLWGFLILGWCSLAVRVVAFLGPPRPRS